MFFNKWAAIVICPTRTEKRLRQRVVHTSKESYKVIHFLSLEDMTGLPYSNLRSEKMDILSTLSL